MCFDQLTTVVDAHQRPIATHIHRAANPPCRYGVERLLETDVMIWMYFTQRPLWRVEPRRMPWNQRRPFFLLEDLGGYSSSRPMNASSGNIAAPVL